LFDFGFTQDDIELHYKDVKKWIREENGYDFFTCVRIQTYTMRVQIGMVTDLAPVLNLTGKTDLTRCRSGKNPIF